MTGRYARGAMRGAMGLRIEMFPADIERFVDFYTRVLRFELVVDRRSDLHPYVAVRRGETRIGAAETEAAVDPAARAVPSGIEVVLEVEDLRAERDAIASAGSPLDVDIAEQPWGLEDFRCVQGR